MLKKILLFLLIIFAFTACFQADKMKFSVDKTKCNACAKCVKECPQGAITIKNGKAEIDLTKCTGCGLCVSICPQDAIR